MDIQLLIDFLLFLLIGTGVAFFQVHILKRDFPGRNILPLAISLIGSFCGSLVGSLVLSKINAHSLLILSASSLVLSYLFLQIFYVLTRMKDIY